MNHRDRRASSPLRFVSCMELREALARGTMDEQRLLELIEEVPGDSIYYHTHSYYFRHPYAQGPFPNDFATWVTLYAQDRLLGERLANEQEWEFLTRTMQAKCKAFETIMDVEGQAGTITMG